MRRIPHLAGFALLLGACGDNVATPDGGPPDAVPPPDAEIRMPFSFPALGSLSLPSGKGSFRFGAASAATQIEDQNPNTDWYLYTGPRDSGGLGVGTFVGDAAGGYTRAVDDIQLLKDTHLDAYRFSIEWARVEPTRDQIDEAALAHYDAVIDGLIAAGIRPMITIHHFSNPVWIDDPRDNGCRNQPSDTNLCGFGHPQGGPLVVEEMAEHARLLAARYGDRVDEWGTLNEPVNYLVAAHGVGVFPPGKYKIASLLDQFMPVVRDFLAGHAAMYAAIKAADTVDADGDGVASSVGLTLNVADWQPARDNLPSTAEADAKARDRVQYVYHYMVPDALTTGLFDADLDGVAEEAQPSWKGTLDWLGMQYYSRSGVTSEPGLIPVIEATPCSGGFDLGSCLPPIDITYCVPAMGYEFYAPGLGTVLDAFTARYPSVPLLVSESGLATEVGERRAQHIVRTLEVIDRARVRGVDVRGYYHWSLFDNFEWAEGYAPRFGLYRVDYATFARTPTLGATVLGEIAGSRTVTLAQREQFGGNGPMTREPILPEGATRCDKILKR